MVKMQIEVHNHVILVETRLKYIYRTSNLEVEQRTHAFVIFHHAKKQSRTVLILFKLAQQFSYQN
jgi:hypothetical protein